MVGQSLGTQVEGPITLSGPSRMCWVGNQDLAGQHGHSLTGGTWGELSLALIGCYIENKVGSESSNRIYILCRVWLFDYHSFMLITFVPVFRLYERILAVVS